MGLEKILLMSMAMVLSMSWIWLLWQVLSGSNGVEVGRIWKPALTNKIPNSTIYRVNVQNPILSSVRSSLFPLRVDARG